MDDRRRSGPETTWGSFRAVLQAMAGVAYLLEDHPAIGGFLLVVAVATAVYETVAWRRHRARATRDRVAAPRHGADSRRWDPRHARVPFRT